MTRPNVLATRAVVTAGVSALLLLGITTPAAAEVVDLTAQGSGADEAPPAGSDTVQGTFRIDTDAGTLTYTVAFESAEDTAAAHIHQGASGAVGPVVVPFEPAAIDDGATTTVTVDAAILQAIIANPANYYINVHTASFPNGAARGQLVRAAAPPATTATTTTATSTTTSRSVAVSPTGNQRPTAVAAGSGGQFAEAQDGFGGAVVLTLGLGLLVIGTAGVLVARRRNS